MSGFKRTKGQKENMTRRELIQRSALVPAGVLAASFELGCSADQVVQDLQIVDTATDAALAALALALPNLQSYVTLATTYLDAVSNFGQTVATELGSSDSGSEKASKILAAAVNLVVPVIPDANITKILQAVASAVAALLSALHITVTPQGGAQFAKHATSTRVPRVNDADKAKALTIEAHFQQYRQRAARLRNGQKQ